MTATQHMVCMAMCSEWAVSHGWASALLFTEPLQVLNGLSAHGQLFLSAVSMSSMQAQIVPLKVPLAGAGASSAVRAGLFAGNPLQQPYAAPAVLIISALLVAAAIAQGFVAAFAALRTRD